MIFAIKDSRFQMQKEKLPSCEGISLKSGKRSRVLCRQQHSLIRAILSQMHQPDNAEQMLHLWQANRSLNILKILTSFIYNL